MIFRNTVTKNRIKLYSIKAIIAENSIAEIILNSEIWNTFKLKLETKEIHSYSVITLEVLAMQ